ncbi:ribonuclease H2 subunit B isoform X1 [Schistocerca americana]|uniref:ribonuclease H2 subunit B isoform X1 n=1 Tax=Schistocerca americana TaxID=7009 RepID=UPI001F4F4FC4|nr:ribonuclease H2 subunit B isoform X1 [Schistocerca americana]XP_047108332.1 ribonuclease H2 subunit B isoform X1 [Schistocerca piceifrons]XP_049856885.1 ribonuclease H2 subunit B-like isoform X1 [Schistocerca gregaria]XP_049949142.1 ribonuclease H2 subunit B isoform X1 [Schistocerca serialis cubense]
MPRIKASPKKCVKSPNPQQPSNTWVLLLKGENLDGADGTPDIVQLRHPLSGAPAMFMFSPGDGMVQEVLTFSENKRSWFIEDSVKSDGKMHLSTPIDPIFLVIPYLRKTSHAVPLDQLLKDEDYPETERLLRSTGLKHLSQVADKKGDEELNAYKYNEEKALNWLQRKTERVAEVLKQKGVQVNNVATAATFVKSGKTESDDPEAYLKYAHGLVSEYLADDLSLQLLRKLGLPEEQPSESSKRKLAPAQQQASETKRPRQEDLPNGDALDLTKPEKVLMAAKTSITAKEKARMKAASGSKSISSFFKKK